VFAGPLQLCGDLAAHPGFPQIRTCALNAYGSSHHGLTARRYTECTTTGGGSGNRCSTALK
jgi:hypothetical protein